MRHLIVFFLLMLSGISVSGQVTTDTLGGVVSYMTSQSVYVKFNTTKNIVIGDTLFVLQEGVFVPAILVKNISSTSCVGTPLTDLAIQIGDRIISKVPVSKKNPPAETIIEQTHEIIIEEHIPEEPILIKEEAKKKSIEPSTLKGRISAAVYTNFSDHPENDKQRMRYTLTLQARRIDNTGLSVETYLSFRHTVNKWQEVKDNFKKAFKVYSLALEYDMDNGTRFWLGRKINYNISNIGAIDGLQAEKKWKKVLTGVFAGTRPDHTDYGFNKDLLQYGAYIGNTLEGKNGTIQNTLAIVEQKNHTMTDRRFAYFQHLNSMIKRIQIFTSFEFDLYTLENDQPKNTLDITSIYFSLRYKATDKLSFFGSYDSRNNIIYYETYKNFIDQLLEEQTRQGYRFSFNYRPWKRITIGSNAGYRFQKDNPNPSKNLNSYLTISRVPGLQINATLSAVLIQSSYLDGMIYGIRISRDLIQGKLFGEAEYRQVEYRYKNVEIPLKQSIVGANLSWRVSKKLTFGFNYEGEIHNQQINHSLYAHITQRI